MTLYNIAFYVFVFLAAIAAFAILLMKNVFRAALLLLTTLLCIAGLYILSFAEFVAVAQVLIHAGGVVIVIIFAVMLTRKTHHAPEAENHNLFSGILVAVALAFLIVSIAGPSFMQEAKAIDMRTGVHDTGVSLMSKYVLPFELSGILLLMALIGAAVTATSTPFRKP